MSGPASTQTALGNVETVIVRSVQKDYSCWQDAQKKAILRISRFSQHRFIRRYSFQQPCNHYMVPPFLRSKVAALVLSSKKNTWYNFFPLLAHFTSSCPFTSNVGSRVLVKCTPRSLNSCPADFAIAWGATLQWILRCLDSIRQALLGCVSNF